MAVPHYQLCKQVQALQVSIYTSILLYGCETRTLLADSEKKDPSFRDQVHEETSPYLLLGAQDQQLGAEQDQLPFGCTGTSSGNYQVRKLAWFGHPTRHDSLSKTILRGTLKGGRRRGRQIKCWMDNIKEWNFLPMPELLIRASCRNDWKRVPAESSLMSPRRPNRSRDRAELLSIRFAQR